MSMNNYYQFKIIQHVACMLFTNGRYNGIMSMRHIHRKTLGCKELLPEEGEQRCMCRNSTKACSPFLGSQEEYEAAENAELRYLASILVDIFLNELKGKAKTAKGSDSP